MRVAVCNEASTFKRNKEILFALEGFGLDVFNVGMKEETEENTPLTYIHTGFLAALLLNLGKVDYVIGGCGTGIGFMNSVLQYPGVVCGLIASPLDGWLFSEINQGNCISLPLNKGYGWAGEKNLQLIFEQIFKVSHSRGYPTYRQDSQEASRRVLREVSSLVHLPFHNLIEKLPKEIVTTVLEFENVRELIAPNCPNNQDLLKVVIEQLGR